MSIVATAIPHVDLRRDRKRFRRVACIHSILTLENSGVKDFGALKEVVF